MSPRMLRPDHAGSRGPEHVAVAVRALDLPAAQADPVRLLEALQGESHPWLLESALVGGRLGRVSLLGADPHAVLSARGDRVDLEVRRPVRPGWGPGRQRLDQDPFEAVRDVMPRCLGDGPGPHRELPFLGGAVAVFGYELAEHIEQLDLGGRDDLETPDLLLLLVDRLISVDHSSGEVSAVTLGFAAHADEAEAASQVQLDDWISTIEAGLRVQSHEHSPSSRRNASTGTADNQAVDDLAGTREPGPGQSEYARRVRSVLDDIERGNVYEVNLTQRMSVPFQGEPLALYRALREESPAPFAAFLDLPGVTVVGSSPERFLRLSSDGKVESRPIKGTRPRGETPDRDAALAEELVTSPKDRAENLMIVDLVRNDLGRVCELGSVRVPELMQVEAYATVFQLVSTVVGRLRDDCDGIDLVRACFPPGSMTGAPKIAAMQIAGALEPVRRGIYSGALGYLDVRGGLDLSVVIRSWLLKKGRAYLHVGGAVVADSDPVGEYDETLDKARALHAAIERAGRRL